MHRPPCRCVHGVRVWTASLPQVPLVSSPATYRRSGTGRSRSACHELLELAPGKHSTSSRSITFKIHSAHPLAARCTHGSTPPHSTVNELTLPASSTCISLSPCVKAVLPMCYGFTNGYARLARSYTPREKPVNAGCPQPPPPPSGLMGSL